MRFNQTLEYFPKRQFVQDKHRWTGEELKKIVERACEDLLQKKITAGEKIIFKSANGIEHFIVFLICEKLELLYIPVYDEITDVEFINFKSELINFTELSFHRTQNEIFVTIGDSKISSETATAGKISGCIFKTSGTTSSPSLIFHSFENLWVNAGIASKGQQIGQNSRVLSLLTYSHMGGFCMQALPALRAGAEIIIGNRRDIEGTAGELAQVTHSILVPSMFGIFREYCKVKNIKFDNHPLIVTGSVPVGRLTLRQMLELGFKVQVIYGLTEIGPYVCRHIVDSEQDLKEADFYLGKPMPEYDLKLAEESEEILLDGPCRGFTYQAKTDQLEELPAIGGWLQTGDKGRLSAKEYYFVERISQSINVGGFKVSPREIELLILEIETVEECMVLPESHYILGQVPVAYVKAKQATAKTINQYIRPKLARHKWPRKIIFVEGFPETSIGKFKRAPAQLKTENR